MSIEHDRLSMTRRKQMEAKCKCAVVMSNTQCRTWWRNAERRIGKRSTLVGSQKRQSKAEGDLSQFDRRFFRQSLSASKQHRVSRTQAVHSARVSLQRDQRRPAG